VFLCANNGRLLRQVILNGYSHHQVEVKEHLELWLLHGIRLLAVRRKRLLNVLNSPLKVGRVFKNHDFLAKKILKPPVYNECTLNYITFHITLQSRLHEVSTLVTLAVITSLYWRSFNQKGNSICHRCGNIVPKVESAIHILYEGKWKNSPSQQLFKVFINIYFSATCFGSRWPSSGGIHNYFREATTLQRTDDGNICQTIYKIRSITQKQQIRCSEVTSRK
jgi:hypothetical protein